MTAPVLDRTPTQRMAALQLANRIRSSRAALKENIRTGQTHVTDILADPPGYTLTMKVATLVNALSFYGPAKTGRLLRHAQISEAKTVGGLSVRQRLLLMALLGDR